MGDKANISASVQRKILYPLFIFIFSGIIAALIITVNLKGLFVLIAGTGFSVLVFFYPVKAFLFWLITSPILNFYVKVPLGAGIPDLTFDRITVFMLLIVILIKVILHMMEPHPLGKIEKYMMLFVCFAGFTVFFTPNKSSNFQTLIDFYVTPFFIFFLAKQLLRSEQDLDNLFWAFLLTGIYLAVIGIFQYYTGRTLFVPAYFKRMFAERATGPFVSAIHYGAVMSALLVSSWYILWFNKKHLVKLLLFGFLSLIFFAVVLSLTRAVWVGCIASVSIILYCYPKYRWKVVCSQVLAGIIGFITIFFFMTDSVVYRRITELDPIYNRIMTNVACIRMALTKPVFGYGYGEKTFSLYWRKFMVSVGSIGVQHGHAVWVPHNEFLHILVLTGFTGFFLYTSIFRHGFKASRSLFKINPQSRVVNKNFVIFFWGILGIFVINGLFVDLMFYKYFCSIFYLWLGAIDGQRVIYSTAANNLTP